MSRLHCLHRARPASSAPTALVSSLQAHAKSGLCPDTSTSRARLVCTPVLARVGLHVCFSLCIFVCALQTMFVNRFVCLCVYIIRCPLSLQVWSREYSLANRCQHYHALLWCRGRLAIGHPDVRGCWTDHGGRTRPDPLHWCAAPVPTSFPLVHQSYSHRVQPFTRVTSVAAHVCILFVHSILLKFMRGDNHGQKKVWRLYMICTHRFLHLFSCVSLPSSA